MEVDMTIKQIRKLVEFLNGTSDAPLYFNKRKFRNTDGFAQILNILESNINPEHQKNLKLVTRLYDKPTPSPWECIKKNFLHKHDRSDRRAIYINEIGKVITTPYLNLPTMLNKYEENEIAKAVLEWRLINKI